MVGSVIATDLGLACTAVWANWQVRSGRTVRIALLQIAIWIAGPALWRYGDSPAMGWNGLNYIVGAMILMAGPGLGLLIGLIWGRFMGRYPPATPPIFGPH